jgi:quinol monooxygenase YgiN
MLIAIGAATAPAGRRDELVAAARAVAAATRADDGCLSYGFYADLEDENRIVSVELWTDRASLDVHLDHPHTGDFLRALPDLVAGPPEMSFHEVPDGGAAVL